MGRHVIRTKNFVADAADFILDEAHKALGERGSSELRFQVEDAGADVHPACRNRARSAVGVGPDYIRRRALRPSR